MKNIIIFLKYFKYNLSFKLLLILIIPNYVLYSEILNNSLAPFSFLNGSYQNFNESNDIFSDILTNDERLLLVKSSFMLVNEIEKKKIEMIFFSGTSSKLSLFLFKKAWKYLYPDKNMPEIVILSREINSAFMLQFDLKPVNSEGMVNTLLKKLLENELTINNFNQYKNKRVAYIDDVSDTGFKTLRVYQNLFRVGFKNLWNASFVSKERVLEKIERFANKDIIYSGLINDELADKVLFSLAKKIKDESMNNIINKELEELRIIFEKHVYSDISV